MARALLLIVFAFPFLSYHVASKQNYDVSKVMSRCVGSAACTACSNCSACKWCSGGGTCGVCASTEKKKMNNFSSNAGSSGNTTKAKAQSGAASNSAQCNALTKKGSKCSRAARSNGFCWQHGG